MDNQVHVQAAVMDVAWTRSFWKNVVWTWTRRFSKIVAWTWTRRETGVHLTLLHRIIDQNIQPDVVRRTGFHHNWFILSPALKCHPKNTIIFTFIFDSSFLTVLNHVPFWWSIRPSTIPFFFTPRVPNFDQTFKGSIFQLNFINKQKTFDWFIVIIYASSLL